MIKLSILVPSVPSRLTTFYPRIMTELLKQCEKFSDVEIIGLFDNKKRTVGEKRQDLLNLAKGEYLVFIDDDDRISDDYISSIMEEIYKNPNTDCIVFDCICCIDKSDIKTLCKYGIEFEYGYINSEETQWRGKPAHTMVYKSAIAKQHSYNNSNLGEDIDWVVRACKDIREQTRIDKVLYYYDCEVTTTSETRGLSDSVIKNNIEKIAFN
jgi:glycosyltransferase involved in cell wall biosynthesis